MSECLKEGQKLISVFWKDEESVEVGRSGCLSLEIVMENGQMAGVPWAKATFEGGQEYRYNLATTEGVRLK